MFLSFFRDRFFMGFGIYLGSTLYDLGMILCLIFILSFNIFNVNPKTKNGVWTAPAWSDCMCVLAQEHMFSSLFTFLLILFHNVDLY